MTFATQSQIAGREIVRIVELVLPRCVLRYGNAPCTAGARAQNHPNLVQQSEVFSGGWVNGATLTLSSYIAPNSTMTGVLLVDGNAGSVLTSIYSADISAAAASSWIHGSLHILKGTQPTRPSLQVLANGSGTQLEGLMVLDPVTGVWSANVGALFPKVVDCGSWWRAGFAINKGYHVNAQIVASPAVASGTLNVNSLASIVGSVGVWGAMLAVNTNAMPPYLTRGVESQWLSGLAQACYNTSQTCVVLSAYLPGDQSLFFVDETVDAPRDFDAFAALTNVDLTPSRLNPQMGVAESAKLSVDLRDFSYNDANTDPYVDARSYTPNSQGTFFGRFLARDPYVQGKKIRYYEGYYAGSGTMTFSHYLLREFIVDNIDRPDSRGRVRIVGTDILRLTNGDRSLCPIPSTAALQGNLTAVDTKINLPSSAAAAALTDLHVRIDAELFYLVTQTGCSWTTSRAAGLTTAAVHSAGSVVQVCQTYSYMNVCSIMMDLLVNKSSIPSSYIPTNSWDAEKTQTLVDYNLYNILSTPTPVRDLLREIAQTCDLTLWYDEISQKVSLRHQSPWTYPALSLSDSAHFIADTLSVKARDDLKVSRVGVSYAPTNYIDASGLGRFQLAVNSRREDSRFDGRKSEYNIQTSWLSASHDLLARTIAGRTLLRYSDLAPLEVQYKIDATMAGSVRTGDVVELNTRMLQGVDGQPAPTRMQIIEHSPDFAGHSYRYNALLYTGLTAATSLSIDVSTWNYNVHSAIGGPSAAVRVYLTVNSGIYVGGSGDGYAAITTSGLPAGSSLYLTLIGSSMILGYAGSGGGGAQGNAIYSDPPNAYWGLFGTSLAGSGYAGGAALYVSGGVTAYLDVSGGYLFAGGAGGGGGGLNWNRAGAANPGNDGGTGQGFTNSGGPTLPTTYAGYLYGGSAGVWGGPATDAQNGTWFPAGTTGAQGSAVKLSDPSATYYFLAGYDSTHVKGLVGG